jgi:DNA-directed RNA polymerase subunit RPC12/RpoP
MAEDVTLVGSRVSSMHLAYDCLGCGTTVPVSITDGKASSGDRCLVQRPSDCPKCGVRIAITLVAEPSQGARVAH